MRLSERIVSAGKACQRLRELQYVRPVDDHRHGETLDLVTRLTRSVHVENAMCLLSDTLFMRQGHIEFASLRKMLAFGKALFGLLRWIPH
jgi:hypothetical protein